ncbi:MAG: class D sortase, partial [Oscillospiraceae bacterium]
MKNRKKLSKADLLNGMNYLIYPILFIISGFLIIMITMGSVINPLIGAWDLMMLPKEPEFSNQEQTDNIFTPVAKEKIVVPSVGDSFATIKIPSIEVENTVYYGDDNQLLRKGIGCYTGGYIFGQGRTILLGGHNHTHLKNIKNIAVGAKVNVTTNYGEYVYEVIETKIAKDSDKSAYDLKRKEENLIIYTCYPFNSYGYTPQRFFVY